MNIADEDQTLKYDCCDASLVDGSLAIVAEKETFNQTSIFYVCVEVRGSLTNFPRICFSTMVQSSTSSINISGPCSLPKSSIARGVSTGQTFKL